jgi:arylsulfatase A
MLRRSFLASSAAAAMAQNPERPNVVLFLSDDMGYSDLSCYGAKDIRTPNIDSLAKQGVKFTNAYSNGPVCTPTRCGLLTGRYQQRTGLEWALVENDHGKGLIPDRDPTLARYLKDVGYKTAIFGKWHLGWNPEFGPNAHGFDKFFGLLGGNVDMYSHERNTGQHDLWEDTTPKKLNRYLTDEIGDRAADWVNQQAQNPFFLYVPFNAVHWPFNPPNRPDTRRNAKNWTKGTRQDYKLMLEGMDQAVGKVLDAVERNGLAKKTLVIFTNDNGGERLSDNRPFFHHKQTLFEGGIRVPALMRWPGMAPAGKVVDTPAMSMDFGATILSACGGKAKNRLDGVALQPYLKGSAPPERDLFWRIKRPGRVQRAVRRGPWKYLWDANVDLLFRIDQDPAERVDLYYDNIDRALAMKASIVAWEEELAGQPPPYQVL